MTTFRLDGAVPLEKFVLTDSGFLFNEDECCVDCTECCDDRETEYIVDLGAGGLTDDECDNCAAISGEFTVSTPVAGPDPDVCEWSILTEDWCPGCANNNIVGLECGDLQLRVLLEIVTDDCADCFWRVTVRLSAICVDPPLQDDLDEFCDGGAGGFAIYESAATVENCNDASLPVTLTKVSENWFAECAGSLPGTITLEDAP